MSTTPNRFVCSGHRSLTAETMHEAAEKFALRVARKKYGRRAHVRTCTQGSYAANGALAEYSAFIGYHQRGDHNTTHGHNIHLIVYRA